MLIRFIIGAIIITLGLSLFLLGVDKAITPLGSQVGEATAKSNKLWIVLVVAFSLGIIISIAEPGLLIFSHQVELVTGGQITSTALTLVVSFGLASLLGLGLYRILFSVPLYLILTVLYGIVFLLSFFIQSEILIFAFDASGATTGIMAVPFILALALGVSQLKKDSKAGEKDSFGTIAIVSVGAIISVMILGLFSGDTEIAQSLEPYQPQTGSILSPFFTLSRGMWNESALALLPIFLTFIFFQFFLKVFKQRTFRRMLIGLIYTFLGLYLFLLGVNAGFMDVGNIIGQELSAFDSRFYLVLFAFILGVVTILAEPAVHVLTHQIEDVTSGYVTRGAVFIALSIGVGIALSLSVLRIFIVPLQLWHYLLPGYIIAVGLMYIVPKIFIGIAYDAGGVATGPMTATFSLAFVQGAAHGVQGANIILDGFGMIAMVALTPIITLQLLGLIYKIKSKKGGLSHE